jgi:hypothetical protein
MAQQVQNMSITGTDDFLDSLFAAPPASILGATPPRPPIKGPSKEMASATPRRSARQASARQAGLPATPVAQRASIRLAKELAVIGDEEQKADAAAAALVQRFKTPLDDSDVDGLAVLTRIDRDAILRNAVQSSVARGATEAH